MDDEPNNFLFSITLYRDGQLRIDGHGHRERLPDILRLIADSLEAGHTALSHDESDPD